MVKAFSKAWKASKKPSKQRKYVRNAPRHVRRVIFRSMLSRDLQKDLGIGTLPPRKGDTVRILRGDHAGKEGVIERVDRKHGRVYVQGVTRKRADGGEVFIPLHHSIIMLVRLVDDDRRVKRKTSLQSSKSGTVKSENALKAEKPA